MNERWYMIVCRENPNMRWKAARSPAEGYQLRAYTDYMTACTDMEYLRKASKLEYRVMELKDVE